MNTSDAARDHAAQVQLAYYAETAHRYDDMHVREDDEHGLALQFMISLMRHYGIESVLDLGCGTGRALLRLQSELPNVVTMGVEPSSELRKVGYSKGLLETQLVDGNAMSLAFDDGSFDLVCEFGALHHMPEPSKAVAEMLRVSRKAIFISDSNNFGQGSKAARLVKQVINAAGLWPIAEFIKTKGKGYTISEGDGLGYSYSVFNDYAQVRAACETVYLLNTSDAGRDIYRTAASAALVGVKRLSRAVPGAL